MPVAVHSTVRDYSKEKHEIFRITYCIWSWSCIPSRLLRPKERDVNIGTYFFFDQWLGPYWIFRRVVAPTTRRLCLHWKGRKKIRPEQRNVVRQFVFPLQLTNIKRCRPQKRCFCILHLVFVFPSNGLLGNSPEDIPTMQIRWAVKPGGLWAVIASALVYLHSPVCWSPFLESCILAKFENSWSDNAQPARQADHAGPPDQNLNDNDD